jgi:signal transduction histidine kinase
VDTITSYVNYIFAAIFGLEAFIKIVGYGVRYFKNGWNVFDFVVLSFSGISVLLTKLFNWSGGPATTVIRSLRIARMFKLFRKYKSLRAIFETFLVTLPALANVGGLLILLIYIYAVLGMNLFSTVKFTGILSESVNF